MNIKEKLRFNQESQERNERFNNKMGSTFKTDFDNNNTNRKQQNNNNNNNDNCSNNSKEIQEGFFNLKKVLA